MTALNVDQSNWDQIRVTGEDRVRFVNGLCTSNVETLAEGGWFRTSMLNVKGRVVSVVDVVKRSDELVLLCEPGVGQGTLEVLDKYAIMDDVEFALEQGPLHRVWPDVASVTTAEPVFAATPEPVATPEEVEVRRVEAGSPRFGVDVDENHFPFESRLREQIDYQKGCYLGQEPIARVHAQGKPSRELMGLTLSGDGVAEAGAAVSHPDRDKAGTVTSSVVSERFGPIALAYLHRSVADEGVEVSVAGRSARVVALPFGGG